MECLRDAGQQRQWACKGLNFPGLNWVIRRHGMAERVVCSTQMKQSLIPLVKTLAPRRPLEQFGQGKHGAEHFAQPPAKVPVSKLPFALTKLVSQSYCWLGRFYTNVHQLAQCRLGVHLYSMASWLSGSSMTTPALAWPRGENKPREWLVSRS